MPSTCRSSRQGHDDSWNAILVETFVARDLDMKGRWCLSASSRLHSCVEGFESIRDFMSVAVAEYLYNCTPNGDLVLPNRNPTRGWIMKMGQDTIEELKTMFAVRLDFFDQVPTYRLLGTKRKGFGILWLFDVPVWSQKPFVYWWYSSTAFD